MCAMDAYLEKVWGGILSEDDQLIMDTYNELADEDKQTVFTHLQKMVSEDGWLPVQVKSASKAIMVIENIK